MYVKIHKNGNQWFREDNGALVGTDVNTNTKLLNLLKSIYGADKRFAITEKDIILIYYGYYDSNNIFNHFCEKNTGCRKCHPVIKERFCYKRSKSHKSAAYYIKEN